MSHTEMSDEPAVNPINIVEQLVAANNWTFERGGDNEISLTIEGQWCDYSISFSWIADMQVLHLTCGFEFKIPEPRYPESLKLAAELNQQLWLGHFDLWCEEGMVLYRVGLLITGGATVTEEQCRSLLQTALSTAERHYSAFQFVVWAGKTAKEAMEASLFETAGEA